MLSFEIITVDNSGKIINRRPLPAIKTITEDLGNGVILEMVEIPGGKFNMGSPASEAGRRDNESPQHQVTISPFLIGKFTVTQAQWQAVTNLPKVQRDLKPDPSNFKGKNRPVEGVSWYDAVEFCARLSQKTGKTYRLPSEAEWEYACRAGTTTPFHFGATITTDLANYDGNSTYGSAPKGQYRQATTDVGTFPPNAFGLYDMHGNVWEWCADVWHKNYNGAPVNGSVWSSGGNNSLRVLRGGSWGYIPEDCRSANRFWFVPDVVLNGRGFRVILSSPGG
jgi:formylglycine-generating enzyme required for sulfatase activity